MSGLQRTTYITETSLRPVPTYGDLDLTTVGQGQSQVVESTNWGFVWTQTELKIDVGFPESLDKLTVTHSELPSFVVIVGSISSYFAETAVKNIAVEYLESGDLFDGVAVHHGFNFAEWCVEHKELFAGYSNTNVAVNPITSRVLFEEPNEELFVEKLREMFSEGNTTIRTVHVSSDGVPSLP